MRDAVADCGVDKFEMAEHALRQCSVRDDACDEEGERSETCSAIEGRPGRVLIIVVILDRNLAAPELDEVDMSTLSNESRHNQMRTVYRE